jgi:pyruvate dehydrogenase E2 component (dihydrolipoamide acetyltransferase)
VSADEEALSFVIGRPAAHQTQRQERSMSDAIKPIGMPKWGLAMTEGKVNAWLVEEGVDIASGDEILEIETSKITNVFESPVAGLLRRKVAAEGETLPVGALLGVVADADVSEAAIDAYVEEAKAAQAEAAAAAVPPPEPVMVQAEGWNARVLRMAPELDGGAPPLLLIHGFGGDLQNWQFNQPDLALDRAVYALDLPGHGGSSKTLNGGADVPALARAVRAALAALGVERFHVAGHSLGGAIALRLALDEPERVVSVSLVCSAGLGPEINISYIENFIRSDKRKDMKATVEALFADPAFVSRDMVDDLLKYKRLDGVLPALRAIADAVFTGGMQTDIFIDDLGTLDVPVQAIWGEADAIIPVAHARTIPEARRHVLAGAGHMVHIEKPSDVTRLIGEFVAFASG